MAPGPAGKYAAYDLRTYFFNQPREIRCCLRCGGPLQRSSISASRAVAAYLATAAIPEHEFTRLYQCKGCGWWAIWESWADCEYFAQDFLSMIASVAEDGSSWEQALQDEGAYDHEQPLPEELGRLFVGGKRRMPALLKPGDRVRLVTDVVLHHPTGAGPMEFLGTQGTEGMIVDLAEYEAQSQRLQGSRPAPSSWRERQVMNVNLGRARMEIREGMCYPIRLAKIEPVSRDRPAPAERTGALDLCKEGTIYLVYVSDVIQVD